jgi:hypothetical protein
MSERSEDRPVATRRLFSKRRRPFTKKIAAFLKEPLGIVPERLFFTTISGYRYP